MSVATVYMTEFSDEAALKEVLEYCQKHVKTGYPEAEALIFIQASPSSGVGVVMWPSEEIREEESMAQRAVFTERFGASIKVYLQYWGEVLVKQINLILLRLAFY